MPIIINSSLHNSRNMNKVIPFYIFFMLLVLSISYSFTYHKVYGDGLFMEQLSASLGDRKA